MRRWCLHCGLVAFSSCGRRRRSVDVEASWSFGAWAALLPFGASAVMAVLAFYDITLHAGTRLLDSRLGSLRTTFTTTRPSRQVEGIEGIVLCGILISFSPHTALVKE